MANVLAVARQHAWAASVWARALVRWAWVWATNTEFNTAEEACAYVKRQICHRAGVPEDAPFVYGHNEDALAGIDGLDICHGYETMRTITGDGMHLDCTWFAMLVTHVGWQHPHKCMSITICSHPSTPPAARCLEKELQEFSRTPDYILTDLYDKLSLTLPGARLGYICDADERDYAVWMKTNCAFKGHWIIAYKGKHISMFRDGVTVRPSDWWPQQLLDGRVAWYNECCANGAGRSGDPFDEQLRHYLAAATKKTVQDLAVYWATAFGEVKEPIACILRTDDKAGQGGDGRG